MSGNEFAKKISGIRLYIDAAKRNFSVLELA